MAKIALLIGVSDYEPGLDALPSAVRDVTALQAVLANSEMGGFEADKITVLQNPDRQRMADAIYRLFANRQKDDLVLLYFSGHGVVDDSGNFYFTSHSTQKEQGRLVPTTALAARDVQQWMEQSRSQRKVVVLDSCFSGAFARGVKAKDGNSVNLETFLGGKGSAILTATTSTQYALTQDGLDLSVYTHYLVEGIRTGGADLDDDGLIAIEELHTYASAKVNEAAPAMTPEFYPVKDGYKIILAKSPKDDPNLKYRKDVKQLAAEDDGNFSFANRAYLEEMGRKLGLSAEAIASIEAEELEPYRQRQAKVERYRSVFAGTVEQRYPLSDRDRTQLKRFQELLSLRDEDIEAIEAPILRQKQVDYERNRAEQERRQAELNRQTNLKQQQHAELERQLELIRQAELKRQQQAEPERQRQAELERQQQAELKRQQQTEQEQQAEQEQQRQAKLEQERRAAAQIHQWSAQPLISTRPNAIPITRQQFLKWAGFSSGGLFAAWIGNRLLQTSTKSWVPDELLTAAEPSTMNFETLTVNDRGEIVKREPLQATFFKQNLGNGITLDMVAIPAGEFLMGSPDSEAERDSNESPQHQVKMPDFYMGRYTITQSQWRQVAKLPKVNIDLEPEPSQFKGANRPVVKMLWEEAMEFCDRISLHTGRAYRLPSEAEWEYACRAGTTTPFHFGATITPDLVNYKGTQPYGNAPKGKYRSQTTEVGSFPPNAFGLHDMHGNVWEWCLDHWHENYQGAPTDGRAWVTDDYRRMLRGGSWRINPRYCRSAYRNWPSADDTPYDIGFRVTCSLA